MEAPIGVYLHEANFLNAVEDRAGDGVVKRLGELLRMVVEVHLHADLFCLFFGVAHYLDNMVQLGFGGGVRAADADSFCAESLHEFEGAFYLVGSHILVEVHVCADRDKSQLVKRFFQRFGIVAVETGKFNAIKAELFYFFENIKKVFAVFHVVAEGIKLNCKFHFFYLNHQNIRACPSLRKCRWLRECVLRTEPARGERTDRGR